MKLVRGAWKLLVGIKDAMVLVALLLFFGALFAALNMRPGARPIRDGALLVSIDGRLVEQPAEADPLAAVAGGTSLGETRARDVIRALDAARGDARVRAVVLDLDRFAGGYPATVGEVAAAVGRVRARGKPVLAYATAYMDSSYMLAAHASEVWVNPMGGTLFSGPGGSQLYYKGLLDRLGVAVNVFRVGQFKSAVEPYTLTGASEPARAASAALSGALLEQWRETVTRARPRARVAEVLARPDAVTVAAGGDLARMNLQYGLVDRLGDRTAFGTRVAQVAGADPRGTVGGFSTIRLADFVAAHPTPTAGNAVGVLTVAGTIVDGRAPAGTAGGETVSRLLLDGLARNNLRALVVRIDSPGGSALASEQIRQAVLQARARRIPVVVSMGGLAASGGYWVATAGDTILAEPNTITGSIGIFGIVPSFETTLARIGVTTDGVRTTPLSGQPDLLGGLNPEVSRVLQAGIEAGYRRFIGLVANARRMTPERVDSIAQGRVWDGGSARQLGLVDRFGGMEDAMAEAARRAGIPRDSVRPVYLERQPNWAAQLAAAWSRRDEGETVDTVALDPFSRLAAERRLTFAAALGDARRLATGPAMQAQCLECAGYAPAAARAEDLRLLDLVMARLF